MTRYYFDIRDDGHVYPDDEGLELEDMRFAIMEATATLSNLAWSQGRSDGNHDVTIEVRTTKGPLFHVALAINPPKH